MILAIGNNQRGTARNAFTLLEVLLVIALIALAASVVIVNFTAFADRRENNSPVEVLTKAVREARFIAAAQRITTRLSYNLENGTLVIEPDGREFTINTNFGPEGRGEIRFFLIPPAEGLGSFPDTESSTLQTPSVAFAADRSSSPFIAEIDTGSGSPIRLRFDPFSSVIRTEK